MPCTLTGSVSVPLLVLCLLIWPFTRMCDYNVIIISLFIYFIYIYFSQRSCPVIGKCHFVALLMQLMRFTKCSLYLLCNSCSELPVIIIFASSAYRINFASLYEPGKSFMYTMNNSGPRMLPWGTPYSRSLTSELVPLMCTYCFRLFRYDVSHLSATPRIP